MRIPKYWAQVECSVFDDKKTLRKVRLYGWSDRSVIDAERHARERASGLTLSSNRKGSNAWYLYSDRPLREPIIAEHSEGDSRVVITRSRLGPKVMNTDRVAFIDIDIYSENTITRGPSRRYGFLDKLLRRPDPLQVKRAKLREWFATHSTVGMRLYETPNGFRGIFTHRLLEPQAKETLSLFEELGADPLYIRLCKGQECFRARLSAKAWRINAPVLSGAYPYTFEGTREAHEECIAFDNETAEKYDKQSAQYAACRFSEQLGTTSIHREVQRVIQIHDELSGALSDRPLA